MGMGNIINQLMGARPGLKSCPTLVLFMILNLIQEILTGSMQQPKEMASYGHWTVGKLGMISAREYSILFFIHWRLSMMIHLS